MTLSAAFDIVIPLYEVRWNTRAVLEGLTTHYQPRDIHVVAPAPTARTLQAAIGRWQVAPTRVWEEESFFVPRCGLTKDAICAEIDLGESLYTPGWFYQQLLKLGAPEGIPTLSEWYVVWDSDLLPAATWPLLQNGSQHTFALIQHKGWGNANIVAKWANWIRTVLEIEPIADPVGTFVPHHMWFEREHLASFKAQVGRYYRSDTSWLQLMMRSANEFGTFSEYWAYVSWVAARVPADLAYHPYEDYGETTERFFDDGTGLFSAALACWRSPADADGTDATVSLEPSYEEITAFLQAEYGPDTLPSSLSFESSPRHLQKDRANMHIEELRSRWNPRGPEAAS